MVGGDVGAGRFMFTAIEAQGGVPESGVHEFAVVGAFRVGMDPGAEVAAGRAHALHRDGLRVLKATDEQGERVRKACAIDPGKRGERIVQR